MLQEECSNMAGTGSRQRIAPQQLGFVLCLSGGAGGLIGLMGSLTGLDLLRALLPGYPVMVPNTALSLMLIGVAGALRRQRPLRAASRSFQSSLPLLF